MNLPYFTDGVEVRSFTILLLLLLIPLRVYPQARVDLEDMSVKGELLNDSRMRMSSREATRIEDRVKYRKNFRPEIIDSLDVRLPATDSLTPESEIKGEAAP